MKILRHLSVEGFIHYWRVSKQFKIEIRSFIILNSERVTIKGKHRRQLFNIFTNTLNEKKAYFILRHFLP